MVGVGHQGVIHSKLWLLHLRNWDNGIHSTQLLCQSDETMPRLNRNSRNISTPLPFQDPEKGST